MKELKITMDGDNLTYEVCGDEINNLDAMEMLIYTLMAINDEVTENMNDIEKAKSSKQLKEMVINIMEHR